MTSYRKSRGRPNGGPIEDSELDAMVADVYLAGNGFPDDAQIEFMRNQFRFLNEAFDDAAEEVPFADVTHARDENSYFRKTFESVLIWLYRTKTDRAVGLVIASVAVFVGFGGLFGFVSISVHALLSVLVALTGVLIGAGVSESGRLGYLAQLNWNHIDDLAASLPASVVRGHHRVHEEERAMLVRARSRKPKRLMLIELWNDQRSAPGTEQAAAVEREIDRLIRENPDCEVRSAFSATRETWSHRHALIERRCGQVDQQLFIQNPLQMDAILTDDEAILSFPRGRGDRGLALVLRSKGIVKELWAVFNNQVGEGKTADSISIENSDDIEEAKKWVHDGLRSHIA